jgi:hypothetical protein
MPQLDFFLNGIERDNFIEFAFKNNFKLVPDNHFDSNNYQIINDVDTYLKLAKTTPLIFLLNDKYSFFPLELDFFEKGGRNVYFIKQKCGGPVIDFYSPIAGEIENGIVGPGFVGCYPFYYHNNKKIVPHFELSNSYKQMTTFIRSIAKPVKLSQRTYWLGKETINKAKKDEVKLLPISGIELINLL